jgi:NitT/TauT family transport system substrate-binding protein
MRWLQRVTFCVLAAIAMLLATSCTRREPRRMLRIAATPWIGNTPLMVARERKLFSPTEARIVELSTDFDVWRAILEGRADMVTGTLIDVLRTIDHGADLKIVMAIDFSVGADGIIARDGIPDMRALAGRKVAVEKATLTHFVLIRALERAGMREADVTLENFATDEALVALDDGRVDAAALWEPLLSHAKKPGRTVLFTSAETPGEIIDVLAVRGEILRDRTDAVDDIVRGFHEAVDGFRANPADCAETAARLMSLSVPDATEALGRIESVDLARNRRFFDSTAPHNVWDAYAISARFMEDHGMLRKPARPPTEVLDAGPLGRVAGGRK